MNVAFLINNPLFLFLVALATNIFALGILPKTQGFTRFDMAALCLIAFSVNLWALSRLMYSGISMSLMVPVMTAILPLAVICIGIFVYGETASVMKVSLLITACILIGVASRFS